MAKVSREHPARSVFFHILAVCGALVAAEVICMLLVSPLMGRDQGYVVVAGLSVLPLWATLLALVYTADRRGRGLVILLVLTVICAVLLALS